MPAVCAALAADSALALSSLFLAICCASVKAAGGGVVGFVAVAAAGFAAELGTGGGVTALDAEGNLGGVGGNAGGLAIIGVTLGPAAAALTSDVACVDGEVDFCIALEDVGTDFFNA